jgi:hypothetical protein
LFLHKRSAIKASSSIKLRVYFLTSPNGDFWLTIRRPYTEFSAFDVEGGDLGVGHDNAAGVQAGVEFTAHGKAGLVVVAEISSTITR